MLTDKQKTRLLIHQHIHDNLFMWCYKMAHQTEHSEQQLKTIDRVLAMTMGEQKHYLIIDDKLFKTISNQYYFRKNAQGKWVYQTKPKGVWQEMDK